MRIDKTGFIILFCVSFSLQAEVITDGSISIGEPQGSGFPIESENNIYRIPAAAGVQKAGNLYHSFDSFGIEPGNTALFTDSGALIGGEVKNIIARVTGGEKSVINGKIKIQFKLGSPDLYFLNPNGIVFGKGATLSVPGSVLFSSADYIKFPDGKEYFADASSNPSLSLVDPSSFGFLPDAKGTIQINGGNLNLPASKSLSLIASKIFITQGRITTSNGQVMILGEAWLEGESDSANAQNKLIKISANAPNLKLPNLPVDTDPSSADIFIKSSSLLLQGRVSLEPKVGDVEIDANKIQIKNGAVIDVSSEDGNKKNNVAGKVVLKSSDLLEVSGVRFGTNRPSRILANSSVENNEVGQAGTISISAQNVIVNEGQIRANGENTSSGSVLIQSKNVHLLSGGQIQAFSMASGSNGNPGTVEIVSSDNIIISGSRKSVGSHVSTSGSGKANGGRIFLKSQVIEISDKGFVQSKIEAGKSAGVPGGIVINAGKLSVKNGGSISTENDGVGKSNGGKIEIKVEQQILESSDSTILIDGINSRVVSTTRGLGSGGEINVEAPNIIVSEGGQILSESFNLNSGLSGNITVDSNSLKITGVNSAISVKTEGASAGSIEINTTGLVRLQGESEISTSAQEGIGSGGDINIFGKSGRNLLLLQDASTITAQAKKGAGGVILIKAQSVLGASSKNVNANSIEGENGVVEFSTPDVDATTGTLELPETFVDASELIANRCASQSEGQSSFYVGERGGLGTSPDLLLAGYLDDDGNARLARGSGQSVVSTNANFTGLSAKIVCSR